MKNRASDAKSSTTRRQVDEVWMLYANNLIKAFADITTRNGFSQDEIGELYCAQRLRQLDQEILDSLVYNVPPGFTHVRELMYSAEEVEGEPSESQKPASLFRWGASPESPFILIGYTGIGKTTFLENYFLNTAPKNDPTIVGIIVDFKTAPVTQNEFQDYLLNEVSRHLADIDPNLGLLTAPLLQRLFESEIQAIKTGLRLPQKQSEAIDDLIKPYLMADAIGNLRLKSDLIARKMQYLRRNRGKRIWLVLDNIDQHLYTLHHNAFISAVATAHQWGCPLIISMRYLSLKTLAAKNVYDSYRPRRLRLSLPNVTEVVKKRIALFQQLACGMRTAYLPWTANTQSIKGLTEELNKWLDLLKSDPFITGTLLPLANFNLRRLLDMMLAAFQSYYFFYDPFNNDRYAPSTKTIFKRFLFAHLLKNADFYNPKTEDSQERFIINLFENENKDAIHNQLIRIRLLQALQQNSNGGSLKQLVARFLSVFDVPRIEVLRGLRVFLSSELVAIKDTSTLEVECSVLHEQLNEGHLELENLMVTLSHCGVFHLELIRNLEYLEIMKFSTYIIPKYYVAVTDPARQKDVTGRKRSTRAFLDYLQEEEAREKQHVVKELRRFEEEYGPVMSGIISSITEQYKLIEGYIHG